PAFAVLVQARVDAVREIDAEVTARRQPARRTPAQVRRTDHPVDVLLELFLPDATRRAGAIADERIRHAADETIGAVARAAERLRADADRVVRFVRRQCFDRAVAERDAGIELRIDLRVDRAAERV